MGKPLTSPTVAGTPCGHDQTVEGSWGSRRLWLNLLLAAFILSSIFTVTEAAENITIPVIVDPKLPMVGDYVLLQPTETVVRTNYCEWYKDENNIQVHILIYRLEPYVRVETYEGYDGRQNILGEDCALQIRNVSFVDAGRYRLIRSGINHTERGDAILGVQARAKKEPRSYHAGAVAGVGFGSLVGILLVVSLMTYQYAGTSPGGDMGEARRPPSDMAMPSPEDLSRPSLKPEVMSPRMLSDHTLIPEVTSPPMLSDYPYGPEVVSSPIANDYNMGLV